MDLCLGEIRMDKAVMLRMTWGDLWRVIYGYWIREEREWDRTRSLLAMTYNVNRNKRQPYKPPHRIMPLAIDKMGQTKYEWDEQKYEKFDQALAAWGLDKTNGSTKQHSHQDSHLVLVALSLHLMNNKIEDFVLCSLFAFGLF